MKEIYFKYFYNKMLNKAVGHWLYKVEHGMAKAAPGL